MQQITIESALRPPSSQGGGFRSLESKRCLYGGAINRRPISVQGHVAFQLMQAFQLIQHWGVRISIYGRPGRLVYSRTHTGKRPWGS